MLPIFSHDQDSLPVSVIVSGLPRSGTSLLMQMLAAGGVPPLTDARRAADENNPKGYLELEAVKKLTTDPTALDAGHAHAVKVVAMLLPHLPRDHRYFVLFLHRDLQEVIASQRQMIRRMGKPAVPLGDDQLRAALEGQVRRSLAWCQQTSGVELRELQHRDLCLRPEVAIETIVDFLGPGLDREAMQAVPDPTLYRQRS